MSRAITHDDTMPARPPQQPISGELAAPVLADGSNPEEAANRRMRRFTGELEAAGVSGIDSEAIAASIRQYGDQQVKASGSNGGSSPPPIDLKKLAKKNWAVNTLIALVVAGAAALTTWRVVEQRSVDNEEGVKQNKAAIDENTKTIGEVQVTVDDVKDELLGDDGQGGIKKGVTDIGITVEALTKEAQTRKQKTLAEKAKALEEKAKAQEAKIKEQEAKIRRLERSQ